jgi:hypothetical protein
MQWPEGANPVLELETSPHNEPGSVARFVTWIPWDSGFRGSGLRVGDLIAGHAGIRYTPETVEKRLGVGDASFSRWFDEQKFKPGDPFTLIVLRGGEETEITGTIGAYRTYKNAQGVRILGEGGPVEHEKDGFDYAWNSWYRQFVDLAKTVLAGWDYFHGTNTKNLAERIQPFADRVAYLEKNYPGALARTLREDFEAMKQMVAGEPRTLSEEDLAYRGLGEARAAQATAAADAAFNSFLAEVQDALMKSPPSSPNSFTEDTRPLVGKMIRLREVGRQQILFETRRSWYWSGSGGGGYLLDRHSETMQRLYAATSDYIEKADPNFRDYRVTFTGIVQPEPALVSDAYRNITVSGLKVEPVAALVVNASQSDRRLFVDFRPGKMAEPFAGAAALAAGIRRPVLKDDAGPGDVLMTAIEALKMGDIETWRACYANWMVRSWYEKGGSYLYVDRTWEVMSGPSVNSTWDSARKRLMDDVYGVEVAQVSPVRTVYDAAAQPAGRHTTGDGAPRLVQEVRVRINHIGKVGNEFRTFAGFMLHRTWELQRLDGGPWRITSNHAI